MNKLIISAIFATLMTAQSWAGVAVVEPNTVVKCEFYDLQQGWIQSKFTSYDTSTIISFEKTIGVMAYVTSNNILRRDGTGTVSFFSNAFMQWSYYRLYYATDGRLYAKLYVGNRYNGYSNCRLER